MITRTDVSRVRKICERLQREFKKDGAKELNRFMKDVGFRAMSFTPFASPAKIEKDLKKNERLLMGAAAKAIRATGQEITRERLSQTATKILAARKAGSKFRRAGWIPGVLKLGGTIRGKAGGVLKPNGAASRGYAKPATIFKLFGEIANATYGEMEGPNEQKAKQQMQAGLKKAVRFVTRDRIKYMRKKYEKMHRDASDR